MKKLIFLPFFCLFYCYQLFAQSLPNYVIDWPNLNIGMGFTFRGPDAPTTMKEIWKTPTFKETIDKTASPYFDIQVVHDSKSLSESFFSSVDLSARYLTFKLGGHMQEISEKLREENSLHVLVKMGYSYPMDNLNVQDKNFTDSVQSYIDKKDCNGFVTEFGEYFVSDITRGYHLSIDFSFTNTKISSYSEKESAISLSQSSFASAAELILKSQQSISQLFKNSIVHLTLYDSHLPDVPEVKEQLGKLNGKAILNIDDYSKTLQEIATLIEKCYKNFNHDSAGILKYNLNKSSKVLFSGCNYLFPSETTITLQDILQDYSKNEKRINAIKRVTESEYKKLLPKNSIAGLNSIYDSLEMVNKQLKKIYDLCNMDNSQCHYKSAPAISVEDESAIFTELVGIRNKYEFYIKQKEITPGSVIYLINDTFPEIKPGETIHIYLQFSISHDCPDTGDNYFYFTAKSSTLNNVSVPYALYCGVNACRESIDYPYIIPSNGLVNLKITFDSVRDKCQPYNLNNLRAIVNYPVEKIKK